MIFCYKKESKRKGSAPARIQLAYSMKFCIDFKWLSFHFHLTLSYFVIHTPIYYNICSHYKNNKGTANAKPSINKVSKEDEAPTVVPSSKEAPPAPIRITLASLDEYNLLLQNGLDFYGATYFPTELNLPNLSTAKIYTKRGR